LPASGVQVFGPNTVDSSFNSTGEKTLLTMDTSLPSGGRNIILVSYAGHTSLGARGVFRIYKGSTLLYETRITGEYFTETRTRPFHHLLIAVDSSPAGNDSYSFRINVTTAASSSASVHVQGMVIKADTAVWGYNTTAVNIASGGTATVTSINTSFPSGSKVAVIATVYAGAATTTTGNYLVGAGNIKLKSGATVVSSNQFNIGSYRDIYPLRASLIYLDIPTSDSQTYSVEITNGSTVAHNCYAEIVAFDVTDAAFLDTGSVAVGITQTTVGNLSTTLSGDVAVIALAAAERTATNDGDTFLANAVVLQKDGSSTDQVSNLLTWYIFRNSYNARSGILPLFRYDTGVTNPSYQVKMTAFGGTPNGEAKILAFKLQTSSITYINVSDSITFTEAVSTQTSRIITDTVTFSDMVSSSSSLVVLDELNIMEASSIGLNFADFINLTETVMSETGVNVADTINLTETTTTEARVNISDAVNLTETASTETETSVNVSETITLTETIVSETSINISDVVNLMETLATETGVNISDSITLTEATMIENNMSISDIINLTETASRTESAFQVSVQDTLTISEIPNIEAHVNANEVVSFMENVVLEVEVKFADTVSLMETTAIEAYVKATDFVNLTEMILTEASINFTDAINLNENIGIEAYVYPTDLMNIVEDAFKSEAGEETEIFVSDTIILTELIKINAVMRRMTGIKRLLPVKRIIADRRETETKR
jgi:hypothetical protein